MRGKRIVAVLIASALTLCGQTFTQRGFVDVDLFGFPQTAPNDAGHAVGSALVRWEAQLSAGAMADAFGRPRSADGYAPAGGADFSLRYRGPGIAAARFRPSQAGADTS